MKLIDDEIRGPSRHLVDLTHLTAFGLGIATTAVLFAALGLARGAGDRPITSGKLAALQYEARPGIYHGGDLGDEESASARLHESFLIIERPGSTQVIPADRIRRLEFRR